MESTPLPLASDRRWGGPTRARRPIPQTSLQIRSPHQYGASAGRGRRQSFHPLRNKTSTTTTTTTTMHNSSLTEPRTMMQGRTKSYSFRRGRWNSLVHLTSPEPLHPALPAREHQSHEKRACVVSERLSSFLFIYFSYLFRCTGP